MNKKVVIVGAGIAGLEAANQLVSKGCEVTLVEQNGIIGGNVRNWDSLLPNEIDAEKVLTPIISKCSKQVKILTNKTVARYNRDNKQHRLALSTGEVLNADAILLSTGFKVFDAFRKEEYGYGIYNNVITSADFEKLMAEEKQLETTQNTQPKQVAFIHCVGSRDEKVGNTYCSKLCCATAVKQAIEVKEMYPDSEVFCFYMDLRMYDRYFEDLYLRAQKEYGVTFIRGRLSEVAETFDGRLQLKAEDTLVGKPLKLNVDVLVLMVGMEPCKQSSELAEILDIAKGADGFFTPKNEHTQFNLSQRDGIFLAGACKGPKNITETIADARSAADTIYEYLTSL